MISIPPNEDVKLAACCNWAYIAGFFDGEGCLHAISAGGARNGRFRVTISQADDIVLTTLRKIAAFLNEQAIAAYVCAHRHSPGRNKLHWKQLWNLWITHQASIVKFIDGVFPYLEIKRQRAEDYRRLCIMTPSLAGAQSRQAKIARHVFIDLMTSGKTITEIAEMYKMDYSSLWMKAKRLGFHVDSTEESNRKRALVPWDVILKDFEGLGQYQLVARKHGIPSGNLRKRLIRNGVTPNPPWPTRDFDKRQELVNASSN